MFQIIITTNLIYRPSLMMKIESTDHFHSSESINKVRDAGEKNSILHSLLHCIYSSGSCQSWNSRGWFPSPHPDPIPFPNPFLGPNPAISPSRPKGRDEQEKWLEFGKGMGSGRGLSTTGIPSLATPQRLK